MEDCFVEYVPCGEYFASKRRLNGHIVKVHARNSNSEENSNDQVGKNQLTRNKETPFNI